MTKTYCDICEVELTRDNTTDIRSNYDGLKHNQALIRIQFTIFTRGDFCRKCLVAAVREYDGY